MNIRPISKRDIQAVAQLIRSVMTEFKATGQGFSIMDIEVDNMYEAYNKDRHRFYVITDQNDTVLGCGGIGAPQHTCELKKMYFYPELRGKGMGKKLMNTCLEAAQAMNYTYCYIETLTSMEAANALYQQYVFVPLKVPMGNTGHSGCNSFYLLSLTQ